MPRLVDAVIRLIALSAAFCFSSSLTAPIPKRADAFMCSGEYLSIIPLPFNPTLASLFASSIGSVTIIPLPILTRTGRPFCNFFNA